MSVLRKFMVNVTCVHMSTCLKLYETLCSTEQAYNTVKTD